MTGKNRISGAKKRPAKRKPSSSSPTAAYFFFFPLALATVALKVAPAENFGTVVAAILIFSPVFGFLPSRAARAAALKDSVYDGFDDSIQCLAGGYFGQFGTRGNFVDQF